MTPDIAHAPPEEAVGLAIDSYIAALTDDALDALLARTRAPKADRYPAKRNSKSCSASGGEH
jgi:hypothetical protein